MIDVCGVLLIIRSQALGEEWGWGVGALREEGGVWERGGLSDHPGPACLPEEGTGSVTQGILLPHPYPRPITQWLAR